MSPARLRTSLRYLHIATGILIALYIYSPSVAALSWIEPALKFVIFPLIALTGLVMWKQAWFRGFFSAVGKP